MPLPSDEKLLALSKDILETFAQLFGKHPGFRPAHAKGLLLAGQFTPTKAALSLSRAAHFQRASTSVFVRFSSSTGIPLLPDTDPNGEPRGIAIRFQLGEHEHTDIVAHSANGFPARDGQEFLAFLRAVIATGSSTDKPSPIEAFLGAHPPALAFVQLPKPFPSSFSREQYFGLTAFRFLNAEGKARYGRYRIEPIAGVDYLDDAAVKGKGDNYLFDELAQRIAVEPVGFRLLAQLANDGDVVDDVSVHWPSDRAEVELGQLRIDRVVDDNAAEQKQIIFDPIPRLDGLEPSADPLLELRAAVYLLSGRSRRAAP